MKSLHSRFQKDSDKLAKNYLASIPFDQSASPGFIHIWGLSVRTQARVQSLEQLEKLEIKTPNKEEPRQGT